jgi:two-component system, NtrC family, response regulator GlrR
MADPGADTVSSLGAKKRPIVRRTPGLIVLLDGGKPRTQGSVVSLAGKATLRIGRAEDCDLTLDDETASRQHAEFVLDGEARVRDCQSRQGTFVDGVRVENAVLQDGSLLRIGRSLLLYLHDSEGHVSFEPDLRLRDLVLAGGFWARRLIDFSERFASADVSLMLLGETGVGKEVAAHVIHQMSGRKGPFRAVNCAAIQTELADSELFGHKRGAFSGANETRVGHIESAEGGTLLLDEVGDLPLALQVKLLRAIETREFHSVGSTELRKVNVRFLAATSRDLEGMVNAGTFRQDLLFRLQGIKLLIPPLRERREEIPWIVLAATQRFGCTITAKAMEHLMLRDYRGNVRELLSVLNVGLLNARYDNPQHTEIEVWHLAEDTGATPSVRPRLSAEAAASTREVPLGAIAPSDEQVRAALALEAGNVSRAAVRLGVHRAQVYRVLRAEGMQAKQFRKEESGGMGEQ